MQLGHEKMISDIYDIEDGEFECHYCNSPTSFHLDHKGRVFVQDEDETIVLNESGDLKALRTIKHLVDNFLEEQRNADLENRRTDRSTGTAEPTGSAG